MFLTNFSSVEVISAYCGTSAEDLEGAEILLAWYGYGDYCGASFVLYRKDGKLYEVNGSHCSCNGLEECWEPEETTWAALKMRAFYSSDCEGHSEAKEAFDRLVAEEGV